MDVNKLSIDENKKNYIKQMNLNEEQTALFLLGYLVGEIGKSQSKGLKDGNIPILNKINFSGMDKTKVLRFANDVFNKLKQQKILNFKNQVMADTNLLLLKNYPNWSLNKHENLFYILSGYSYSIKYIKNKENEENGGEKHE